MDWESFSDTRQSFPNEDKQILLSSGHNSPLSQSDLFYLPFIWIGILGSFKKDKYHDNIILMYFLSNDHFCL